MTTQKPPLVPVRRASATYYNKWMLVGRHHYGADDQPIVPATAPASLEVPIKGQRDAGSMLGRRTNLRHPFDTFVASARSFPDHTGVIDGDTLTMNDGLREVTFEVEKDAAGGVLPGNVAWPVTTGDTVAQVFQGFWGALANEILLGHLDLTAIPNGAVPGATGVVFYSHRSHIGMYGRGALFATSIVPVTLVGWGAEYVAGQRNGYGRSWFPIRWGLKRGWTALRLEQPIQGLL